MSDRQAALDMALKQIEKQFGKGSVMKLGEKTDTKISTSPSGSLALDAALGIGGYPRGRVIEIYGLRVQVRQLLLFMRSQKYRLMAVRRHSLTLNMLLILYMHRTLV